MKLSNTYLGSIILILVRKDGFLYGKLLLICVKKTVLQGIVWSAIFFLGSLTPVNAQPFGTFFVIHLEPGNSPKSEHQNAPYHNLGETAISDWAGSWQDEFWPTLVEFVSVADQHSAKLTVMLTAQWIEFVLADAGRTYLVREWARRGHEIGLHHHGADHPDWDGFTNRPKQQQSQSDSPTRREQELVDRHRGSMVDLLALVNQLGIAMVVTTTTDRKQEMPILNQQFTIDIASKGLDLNVAVREPNRISGLCPDVDFIQLGAAYLPYQQSSPNRMTVLRTGYLRAAEKQFVGVVTHAWDIAFQSNVRGSVEATDYAQWLAYLSSENATPEAASSLLDRYQRENTVGSDLPLIGMLPRASDRFGNQCGQVTKLRLEEPPIVADLSSKQLRSNDPDRLKLMVGMTFHLEGWKWRKSEVFQRYVQKLNEIADLFDRYGARMTIEARDEFTQAVEQNGHPILEELQNSGHAIGLHADLGGNRELMKFTQERFVKRLQNYRSRLQGLSLALDVLHVSGICSHLDWVSAAADAKFKAVTGGVGYCASSLPKFRRPAQFRDCQKAEDCHQIYPRKLRRRIYPWRMQEGSNWDQDHSDGRVIMIPSSGALPCFAESRQSYESYTRCEFSSDDIQAYQKELQRVASFPATGKVRTHYVVWSFGSLPNLNLLEQWLKVVQRLESKGLVQWATIPEMYNAYIHQ